MPKIINRNLDENGNLLDLPSILHCTIDDIKYNYKALLNQLILENSDMSQKQKDVVLSNCVKILQSNAYREEYINLYMEKLSPKVSAQEKSSERNDAAPSIAKASSFQTLKQNIQSTIKKIMETDKQINLEKLKTEDLIKMRDQKFHDKENIEESLIPNLDAINRGLNELERALLNKKNLSTEDRTDLFNRYQILRSIKEMLIKKNQNNLNKSFAYTYTLQMIEKINAEIQRKSMETKRTQ